MTSFPRANSGAFTLLEVMVSMALLAMLITGIYSCWYSIVKGANVAAKAAIEAQRERMVKRTLEDALFCACEYDQNAKYYYFLADSDGTFSRLSFVARLPESFPRSGKFGGLDTRRLTFTVEDGRNAPHQLILRQSSILTDPDKDEMDFPLVLATDVAEFDVEFHDTRHSNEWVKEWVTTNQLPREVRITLNLNGKNQYGFATKENAMVLDVAIPSVDVRPEWQVPFGAIPAGAVPTNNLNTNTTQQPGGPPGRGGAGKPGGGF